MSLGDGRPDADEGDKYARRVSVHARVIQHVTQALPSWASAALAPADGATPQPRGTPGGTPAGRRLSVTGDDSLGEPSGKRRKHKRSMAQRLRDPRVVLLLIAAMCAPHPCRSFAMLCAAGATLRAARGGADARTLRFSRSMFGTMVLLYGRAAPMRVRR